jgi:hypothetical protein
MASLLGIPGELRAIIIDEVIAFEHLYDHLDNHLPSTEKLLDTRTMPPNDNLSDRSGLRYLTDASHYIPHMMPLLLANHQLHREAITRLSLTPLHYTMDLIIRERELCPTWTYLPVIRHNIDALNITISTCRDTDEFTSIFLEGNGGHSIIRFITRGVEAVLSDFLNYGPIDLSAHVPHNLATVTVHKLRINVLSQALVLEGSSIMAYAEASSTQTPNENDYIPETLVNYLASYLRRLWEISHANVGWATTLLKRVENISVSLDGHVKHEMHM